MRNLGIALGGKCLGKASVQMSEQHSPAGMHPCHRGVTIAPGASPQAEIHMAQHHEQRQHPPSPAPVSQDGGCCFVHHVDRGRTELSWRKPVGAAPSLWIRSGAVH